MYRVGQGESVLDHVLQNIGGTEYIVSVLLYVLPMDLNQISQELRMPRQSVTKAKHRLRKFN